LLYPSSAIDQLSTKWALGSDQSSVRSWSCAAKKGVVVCGRTVCRKGLCINYVQLCCCSG